MSKIVFLDSYTLGGADTGAISRLGEYTEYRSTSPDEVLGRCRGAEIVIVNKIVIGAEQMAALPDLKLICVAATGMNNIDLDYAAAHGISVRNAVGYSTHTVAEAAIGDAIALLRQVPYYDRYVKSGAYSASGAWVNFDRPTHMLCGRNWGIIGMGNIGREVARIAEAMGCAVAYASTSGAVREEKYERKELTELLSWADVVSIHCPLSDRTRNLLGKAELALMKPSAIIINVARGGILDEQATADALDGGALAGAAFDVYTSEPMKSDSPLLHVRDADKLILSPHNAWSAVESIEGLVECIARNIADYKKNLVR